MPDVTHPAILARATQSLRLTAANALAASSITETDLNAAIRLIRNQRVNMVTPTLFGAVAHLPHGWDAGLLFEETRKTLFCSDLFHQFGDVLPVVSHDLIGPALAGMR